jgi:mRNA interferase RelE/StbE
MKSEYTERARKSLEDLPSYVRKAFFKQLRFLEQNLHHPSLRAKKYDESKDLWQARVSKDWRFYFRIQDDVYYIVDIIRHPK